MIRVLGSATRLCDGLTRRELMRAGGLSRAKFDARLRRSRIARRAFCKAMADGTAASAGSSPFWCIWGFKP